MAIQCGEQIVQQDLQAAFEGAEQEWNQHRKGKNALPGKGLVVSPMRGDEAGRVEKLWKMGEDAGMDTAKSISLICPYFSVCYACHCNTNRLT